jgi:polysaccharide export outer membrane protein
MKTLIGVLVVFVCFPISTLAQRESLRIGPGDEIEIRVFDTPELSQTAQVNDRGNVSLILGGDIHVVSLTPNEAARTVEAALLAGRIMHAPSVMIAVRKYATQNVTVFGQVIRPASYEIDTPRSLVDVLALAGGFTEIADHHVTIEHPDGSPAETVFVSNDPKIGNADKTLVYPGDKLIIPSANLIYVLGSVGRPGGFPMQNDKSGLTALQAIATAGGIPPAASPNHARLVRRGPDGTYVEIPLALGDMQKGKEPDVTLEANDIIYVPFSYLRNFYLGLNGIVASTAAAALYLK